MAQYEKHFSPSIVHFFTPETLERLNITREGSPFGIARLGQALEHASQILHISSTPNLTGESVVNGKLVKIFPNRTLEPNSGVITRPCFSYSPNPAFTAYGIARAVSFIDGIAWYPRLRINWEIVSSNSASKEYHIHVADTDYAEGAVSTSSVSIA